MMDLSNLVRQPVLMHVPPEAADLSHVFRNRPTKELMGLMRRINKESLIRAHLVMLSLSNWSIKIAKL